MIQKIIFLDCRLNEANFTNKEIKDKHKINIVFIVVSYNFRQAKLTFS